jgi:hypothetical protein
VVVATMHEGIAAQMQAFRCAFHLWHLQTTCSSS